VARCLPLRRPKRKRVAYACGLIAGLLDADTVEVTLRLPPPLALARAVRFPAGDDARGES